MRRSRAKASGEAKLAKNSGDFPRNIQCAAAFASLNQSGAQRVVQNRRAKHAGKMRTAFAPVQTGATARAPAIVERVRQNTALTQRAASNICDDGVVGRQLDQPRGDKPVSDGDPEFAGNMIIACPRPSKRWIDSRRRPANTRTPFESKGHNSFEHPRHVRGCKAIVAVPALCDRLDHSRPRHFRQMAACRGRGNTGAKRKFGRGMGTAIHQRSEHVGAGWIADQRRCAAISTAIVIAR
jgi:hypothetical protein